MKLNETHISTDDVFTGVILDVNKDTVRLPNGKTATRELIRHVGAVCVVPLTDDGKVIMERQFRYPMDEVIYEIPAGKLDSKSENPELAARRELREETGYIPGKMTHLGLFYPAAAYSDERINMYLATELEKGETELDEDEFLDIEEVPLDELVKLIADGKVPDGKTQAAIMRVAYMKEHGMI